MMQSARHLRNSHQHGNHTPSLPLQDQLNVQQLLLHWLLQ